jgi:hypothetical protein
MLEVAGAVRSPDAILPTGLSTYKLQSQGGRSRSHRIPGVELSRFPTFQVLTSWRNLHKMDRKRLFRSTDATGKF